MPTTHPRYMVTDTGDVAEAIDVAAARWPETHSRPELLRLLIAAAAERIGDEVRRERQRRAARMIPELIDADVLLSDEAWR